MRILIVAREAPDVSEIATRLRAEGHRVVRRTAGNDLPERVQAEGVHLVVLDAGLVPDRQLPSLCRSLRQSSAAPLPLFGEAGTAAWRAEALEAGADAYLVPPISADEILAQAHALLRRHPLNLLGAAAVGVRVTAELTLDLASQRLKGGGKETALSDHEFRLLTFLIRHEGAVLGREMLLDAVWGYDEVVSDREIDGYVRYLRQKLESDPAHPCYLLTVWGRGYRYRGLHPTPEISARSNRASATTSTTLLESPNLP